MIDPKELRIGNYVRDIAASDQFFAKVKKISRTRCHYGIFHSAYSDLKPIPLTEEILLRCGFESLGKRGFITTYRHKYIEYLWFKDISISSGIFIFKSLEIECEGLHYLQNLTFFNTGKELDLTPNP